MKPERLVVGRIAKAHGIRGEVAIDVASDDPARFAPGARVFAGGRPLTVASARAHHERLLVLFEGVAGRSDAETLNGAELTIPIEEARSLEDEWSFYPHELAGLAVVDEDGNRIGTMDRVEENPANDLWVVQTDDGEVLVPAVRDIVLRVDVAGGEIVLRPPEGLF
ncbi:MAG TPA: ribosome maturation factor RimM [Actinomycetota bacterium]|nr:ribosome maturation factor RimM [Actinomycetota bacterium]